MNINNPQSKPLDSVDRQQLEYSRNSCVVEVTENMPWVDIGDKEDIENSIFLEGEQAEKFISKAEKLWNYYDITSEEAFLLAAYPYVDLLSN